MPKIREAVIPGTPSGIEMLKLMLAVGGALSLWNLLRGFQSIGSPASHNSVDQLPLLLADTVLFTVGFYGVHRRLTVSWKVGWFYLAFFYVSFIVSFATKLPKSNPLTVLCIGIVMSGAVAVYWGAWWKKQKAYFKA